MDFIMERYSELGDFSAFIASSKQSGCLSQKGTLPHSSRLLGGNTTLKSGPMKSGQDLACLVPPVRCVGA